MEGREEALHELKKIVWGGLGHRVPPLRVEKPNKATLSARIKSFASAHNTAWNAPKPPPRRRARASQDAPTKTTLPPAKRPDKG